MKGWAHAAAALPLAAAVHWAGGSLTAAGLAGAASVLVDLDHVADYVWWRGGWRGVDDFFASYHAHRVTRLLLLMHSWELLLPFWGLLALLAAPAWLWALAVGWSFHLVLDQLANPVGLGFYFLAYRSRRGFERQYMRDRWGIKRP